MTPNKCLPSKNKCMVNPKETKRFLNDMKNLIMFFVGVQLLYIFLYSWAAWSMGNKELRNKCEYSENHLELFWFYPFCLVLGKAR